MTAKSALSSVLVAVVLLAAMMLVMAAVAEPTLASDCTLCHKPGGIAPDGSQHPVPYPPPSWDTSDGSCTVCHEISNSPWYQLPPHGGYPINGAVSPHSDIWDDEVPCVGCHANQLIHGRLLLNGPNGVPAWAAQGPINISSVANDPDPNKGCAGCHTVDMAKNSDPGAAWDTKPIDPATHGDTTIAHAGIYETGCATCHAGAVEDIHDDCMTCHATSPPAGATCTTCHDNLGPNHGDPTAAHANIATPGCAACHGTNVTTIHGTCATCHPPYSGPGITGETCVSCHDDLPEGHGVIAGSRWTYQDLHDVSPKYEGGYECFTCHRETGLVVVNPHGGYDTATNKCKVCHAVHRAEGTYYLLRARSQDDACDFCHIGGAAHSDLVVYTENPAGKYTPNGHTMGAPSRIPDSTTYMQTTTVELISGEPSTAVKVRTYDDEKKRLFRVQFWGRSPAGHPAIDTVNPLTYAKTGPTPLSCSNCHQVHNAISQIWTPAGFVIGSPQGRNNSDWAQRLTNGYKLLRRFPGASTPVPAGQLAGTTNLAKVPESTLIADFNYSTNASFEDTYVDLPGYYDEGFVWRQPDWVVGTDFVRGEAAGVNQYALSVWCADCHNLNIGTSLTTGDSELGFFKAHAERTHPVPASRSMQCYSCHRNDLSADLASLDGLGCDRCHYNPNTYRVWRAGSDFPHSGNNDSIKLLGDFSLASAPQPDGTFAFSYAKTTITEDNIDAVCLRCHTDQGVHQ